MLADARFPPQPGTTCPNCGAALLERRCAQCGAVVGGRAEAAPQVAARAEALARNVSSVEQVFAMPLASTRPQSSGHGASWWVCVVVKPARQRVVLARGLAQEDAVALVGALAAKLNLD